MRDQVQPPFAWSSRCLDPGEREPREHSDMADSPLHPNILLVSRHYDDLINRGDLSAADRDIHPAFVDHAAPPGAPVGPAGVKGWIAMVHDAFPDMTVTMEDHVASGDLVGVVARWNGTHQGPFRGIEATGRSVEFRGMVLWRIEDGLLAERWAVLDNDLLIRTLQAR